MNTRAGLQYPILCPFHIQLPSSLVTILISPPTNFAQSYLARCPTFSSPSSSLSLLPPHHIHQFFHLQLLIVPHLNVSRLIVAVLIYFVLCVPFVRVRWMASRVVASSDGVSLDSAVDLIGRQVVGNPKQAPRIIHARTSTQKQSRASGQFSTKYNILNVNLYQTVQIPHHL